MKNLAQLRLHGRPEPFCPASVISSSQGTLSYHFGAVLPGLRFLSRCLPHPSRRQTTRFFKNNHHGRPVISHFCRIFHFHFAQISLGFPLRGHGSSFVPAMREHAFARATESLPN